MSCTAVFAPGLSVLLVDTFKIGYGLIDVFFDRRLHWNIKDSHVVSR